MLTALLDGRALPAGELAFQAWVSPQTASSHLSKLVAGKLLSRERHGRHRYYKLAGPEVGHALETLFTLAPMSAAPRKHLNDTQGAIRLARTCYDHLAGRLGVQLTEALINKELIVPKDLHYSVTEKGEKWLAEFGLHLDSLRHTRRVFAKQCLDWTERQHHLAGELGAAVLERLFEQKWIARVKGERSVRVTVHGRDMFLKAFDIKS